MKGLNYREIAESVAEKFKTEDGAPLFPTYTRRRAFQDVNRVLTRINDKLAENAEVVRRMELERLDTVFVPVYASALRGDLRAVDRFLALQQRRAKLLGLDMPDKIAPTDPMGERAYEPSTDEERIGRLVALLESARARRDQQTSG